MVQTTQTVYAVVSETDYYGPETRRSLVCGEDEQVIEYDDFAAASSAAEAYCPDYDDSVGCCRLDHNQSSPTCGVVAVRVGEVDFDDWDTLPSDLYDAAAALVAAGESAADALGAAMDDLGCVAHGATLYEIES